MTSKATLLEMNLERYIHKVKKAFIGSVRDEAEDVAQANAVTAADEQFDETYDRIINSPWWKFWRTLDNC